ncbi:hypothetical protein, partial [Enterococcus gallinarum]
FFFCLYFHIFSSKNIYDFSFKKIHTTMDLRKMKITLGFDFLRDSRSIQMQHMVQDQRLGKCCRRKSGALQHVLPKILVSENGKSKQENTMEHRLFFSNFLCIMPNTA